MIFNLANQSKWFYFFTLSTSTHSNLALAMPIWSIKLCYNYETFIESKWKLIAHQLDGCWKESQGSRGLVGDLFPALVFDTTHWIPHVPFLSEFHASRSLFSRLENCKLLYTHSKCHFRSIDFALDVLDFSNMLFRITKNIVIRVECNEFSFSLHNVIQFQDLHRLQFASKLTQTIVTRTDIDIRNCIDFSINIIGSNQLWLSSEAQRTEHK